MKKIILLFLGMIILGCATTQDVVPTQKSNLTVGMIKTKIVEGKSTQNDVIELFGSPNLITTNSEGNEVWTYNKSSYNTKETSGSANAGVLGVGAILGVFGASASSVVSNASTSSLDFIITFNKRGIVEKYKIISASY